MRLRKPTAQQPDTEQFGQTTVIHAWHSDLSRPLREQPMIWPPIEAEHEANPNPKIPLQHQDGPDPVIQNSFWQRMINTPSIPSPILSWNGIIYPGVGCNCAPPDPDGEVGKTQYVQMVNEGLQVFDKVTGTSLLGPIAISSIWSGFGGACQNGGNGDPIACTISSLIDGSLVSSPLQAVLVFRKTNASPFRKQATQPARGIGTVFISPVTSSIIPSLACGRTAITCRQTSSTPLARPSWDLRLSCLIGSKCWQAIPLLRAKRQGLQADPAKRLFYQLIWMVSFHRRPVIRTISYHSRRVAR